VHYNKKTNWKHYSVATVIKISVGNLKNQYIRKETNTKRVSVEVENMTIYRN